LLSSLHFNLPYFTADSKGQYVASKQNRQDRAYLEAAVVFVSVI